MTVDLQFHIAELLTLITMAFAVIVAVIKVIRAADRVTGVLKDFPPHRHTPDGFIIYPDGYNLPQTQRLGGPAEKSKGASA